MSSTFANLPLQKKVALTLLLTMSAFAMASYLVLSMVITPAFEELEVSAARSDLVRAQQAIRTDIRNLESNTADWAHWDDIYEFVNGRNPGFARSNLQTGSLLNLGLNLMAIYGSDGHLVWGRLVVDDTADEFESLSVFDPEAADFSISKQYSGSDDQTVGIISTGRGPMIVSARPILKTDESGPVAGALVMAQFLDDARLVSLRERTEVEMRWWPLTAGAELPAGNIRVGKRNISQQVILEDIFGAPALLLETRTARSISALGGRTVNAAMMFLLLAGLLLLVVMWLLLRRTILHPIDLLTRHMAKIRRSGDLSQQLEYRNRDEIGELAEQFNQLTAEVDGARKALLLQSFKAGKADTAAEVLHNIRNAMTPLINGVERIGKAFRVADDLRVRDATEQLRSDDCPPERGEKLLEYIDACHERVLSSNAEAIDDMRIVLSQARQVEDILADQEKFASDAPAIERVAVNEVVSEAAHVIPKDAGAMVTLDIDRELNRFYVSAHRIGLLQVLGNLILNAYESIQRARRGRGLIRLWAESMLVDDQPMVRLTVQDNGTGFDGDTCLKVFQRGFTSKGEGDITGLGLHWCANAVAGMGGRISAESEGNDKGAEFHVVLPVAQGGLV